MKTKELQELFSIYKNEWQNAVLLNPFFIFQDCTDSENIFEDVAELFLQSTDYMSRPEYYIRDVEKAFLVVCFQYLFFNAPNDEMNFLMIIELLNADIADGKYQEDRETDFERLMKMNRQEALLVNKSLDLYKKKSRYIQQQALKSLTLRLYPLYSFHNFDEDLKEKIISDYDESFLLQLSISLLHNCNSKPEEPLSLISKEMMISYVFACLKFCFENSIYSREKILKFLKNNKERPNFEIKSDNMCKNNQGVAKYWERCKHIQISQEDMNRIDEIKEFYDGCG